MDIDELLLSCASTDDAFWVLEENGLSLMRYSSDLIRTAESRGSELFTNNFLPTAMQESGEFLLIWQKDGAAYILDKFGNLRWEFPANASYYAINSPNLYILKDEIFTVYSLTTHRETSVQLPLNNFKDLIISKNHFYFLQKDLIFHFILK